MLADRKQGVFLALAGPFHGGGPGAHRVQKGVGPADRGGGGRPVPAGAGRGAAHAAAPAAGRPAASLSIIADMEYYHFKMFGDAVISVIIKPSFVRE